MFFDRTIDTDVNFRDGLYDMTFSAETVKYYYRRLKDEHVLEFNIVVSGTKLYKIFKLKSALTALIFIPTNIVIAVREAVLSPVGKISEIYSLFGFRARLVTKYDPYVSICNSSEYMTIREYKKIKGQYRRIK